MAPNRHVVIDVVMAEEVKVLDKALKVVPDRGEEAVGDALLGAELPHDGLNLGEVVVVHAGEQMVLNVVIDAAVDPACDGTPTAGRGCDLLVQEVLFLGIPLLNCVRGQVDTIVAVDNDGPEPLMKSVSDTQGEETLHATEDIFII